MEGRFRIVVGDRSAFEASGCLGFGMGWGR